MFLGVSLYALTVNRCYFKLKSSHFIE